ncbi:MAG: ABC transporter ATP-binding protein/permease [Devosia sp.]
MQDETTSFSLDAQTRGAGPSTDPQVVPSSMVRHAAVPRPPILQILNTRVLKILAGAIVVVVGANTVAQVRLNTWHGDFYGAIEQRDFDAFLFQLWVFLILAVILLVLVVTQTWLREVAIVRLRERLTDDLLDTWLKPRRAFELNVAGGVGVNPDQRLQEDVRHLSELSVALAVGFLQSALLLFTFTGVLWSLSTTLEITVFGTTVVVQGLMLWGTLVYSIAGSLLTYWVGAPLVRLHRERYAREAEFRFALVKVSESAEQIAFHSGEPFERRSLDTVFGGVKTLMLSLAGALARLTWVTSGYGWLAIIAPVVVASPAYFSGAITFGGLMMAVQAFFQVQQSLRWFVDNYPTIADWRATRTRVMEFRDAAEKIEDAPDPSHRIKVAPHPDGKLAFENLYIALPEGIAAFDQERVAIEPGERVLIVGDAGAGKSTFVRAVAGLWPWGEGTILVPPRKDVRFLTHRPYIPLGDLRTALVYPNVEMRPDPSELTAALERVGLGHLAPSLNDTRRWDRELSIDAQQRIAFARLLLHHPRWVFLDEAASACAEDHRLAMFSIFTTDLTETAVVSVSRDKRPDGFFGRILHLRRKPGTVEDGAIPPALKETDEAG